MSHEIILDGPRPPRMTDPILIVRALFRWLGSFRVKAYYAAATIPFVQLYHVERTKNGFRKRGIPFTEYCRPDGNIMIEATMKEGKYNRKKEPERSLDEEARDLDFETGGRCGQLGIE